MVIVNRKLWAAYDQLRHCVSTLENGLAAHVHDIAGSDDGVM